MLHSVSAAKPSNIKKIQGVSLGKSSNTIINPYSSHIDATKSIRESLGVKFSDYFGLSDRNLFLEGETDRLYVEKILDYSKTLIPDPFPVLRSADVQFRDFTGTTDMAGFLRANYYLIRADTVVVSLFDGDAAGLKAVKDLSHIFGKKGGFNSQKDYVLIQNSMDIESIFPDEWILEAHNNTSAWFEQWITDAEDNIVKFKIRDKSKKAYLDFIFNKIDNEKSDQWMAKSKIVLNSIERAMQSQARDLIT